MRGITLSGASTEPTIALNKVIRLMSFTHLSLTQSLAPQALQARLKEPHELPLPLDPRLPASRHAASFRFGALTGAYPPSGGKRRKRRKGTSFIRRQDHRR